MSATRMLQGSGVGESGIFGFSRFDIWKVDIASTVSLETTDPTQDSQLPQRNDPYPSQPALVVQNYRIIQRVGVRSWFVGVEYGSPEIIPPPKLDIGDWTLRGGGSLESETVFYEVGQVPPPQGQTAPPPRLIGPLIYADVTGITPVVATHYAKVVDPTDFAKTVPLIQTGVRKATGAQRTKAIQTLELTKRFHAWPNIASASTWVNTINADTIAGASPRTLKMMPIQWVEYPEPQNLTSGTRLQYGTGVGYEVTLSWVFDKDTWDYKVVHTYGDGDELATVHPGSLSNPPVTETFSRYEATNFHALLNVF